MRVREMMTEEVRGCRDTDDLAEAARFMDERDCGCLPVTDEDGRLVGVVTDRDICMAGYRSGKPLSELPVGETMTRDVRTCSPDASPDEAEYVMRRARVRRLPVVDDDGALVGIVSLADLAREAAHERRLLQQEVSGADIGATLAAICQSR